MLQQQKKKNYSDLIYNEKHLEYERIIKSILLENFKLIDLILREISSNPIENYIENGLKHPLTLFCQKN